MLLSVFGIFAHTKIDVCISQWQSNLFIHNEIDFLDFSVIPKDFLEVFTLNITGQFSHL